jgi:hypothetical protein
MRRECYVCGTATEGINHPICASCEKDHDKASVAVGLDVFEEYGVSDEQPK